MLPSLSPLICCFVFAFIYLDSRGMKFAVLVMVAVEVAVGYIRVASGLDARQ